MSVIRRVQAELEPVRERAKEYEANPDRLRAILKGGSEAARTVAKETLDEVRQAVGIHYR